MQVSYINLRKGRDNGITEEVGSGFIRALYSTYLSYLPKEKFSYPLTVNKDDRGVFVEMLKTHSSGQFSFLQPTQALQEANTIITQKQKSF